MALSSAAVVAGDPVLATDHNELRSDLIAHTHEGTDTALLKANSIQTVTGSRTLTLPTGADDTIVTLTAAQTLTNKRHDGIFYINDTANSFMTTGLTINQGAADNEAQAWKSSDVAHGITTDAETDTFGVVSKYGATVGGLQLRGFATGAVALSLRGSGDTDDVTKATTALAYLDFVAQKKSGTTVGNPGANANLAVIRLADGTTRFILDAEGTLHSIGASVTTEKFGNGETVLSSPIINTPSASGHVYSGTYTPTLTGVANIASSTAKTCQYTRVGNVVTVSGAFNAACTSGSTASEIGISLPIASSFANGEECGGTSNVTTPTGTQSAAGAISADTTNDRATLRWTSTLTSTLGYSFTFTYLIV